MAAIGTSEPSGARGVFHLARTLRLVWRITPGWTAVNGLLAVVLGVLPLAGLYLMKLIIDDVTQGTTFEEAGVLIALAAGVVLLTVFARSLSATASQALSLNVTDYMNDLIHAKSLAVDLEYYENAAYYDVLSRAQKEAPFRPTSIVNGLITTATSVVMLVGSVALLMRLNWVIALIVFAAAIPGALVRVRFSGRLFRWQRDRTTTERRTWYLHTLMTDGARAKEIRLFDLGDVFTGWYNELRTVLRGEQLSITRRRSAADFGTAAVATLAVFAVFTYIVRQAILGVIGIGSMVMYYQALQMGLSSLQTTLAGMAGLYEDNLFVGYFYEFMALEPKVVDPDEPQPMPRPLSSGIVFDDISFAYPDSERTAIEGVSLTIRPGEIAALVGSNGSGKTTLVKLLCRLYDPSHGSITVDGVDLRDLRVADLRGSMSVIFQDFTQYQMTARQNIWVGDVSSDADDAAVEQAAAKAGVEAVIAGLPHGYETMLGKLFEEGEELSVGEWQKIALARAFMRDAEVIVLDEPTSALDPASEWSVFERIREMAEGRAVILVSHRFSTVRTADRIHILDHGRIAESGSHDELMALGGAYSAMYEIQARGFK